jgi:hypothetical protein
MGCMNSMMHRSSNLNPTRIDIVFFFDILGIAVEERLNIDGVAIKVVGN